MKYFSWVSTRNCRKFFKRSYSLQYQIDGSLVSDLEKFGFLETYAFSKFSKSSLDQFKIKLEGELELSGLLKGNSLNVVVPKEYPSFIREIESIIESWSRTKES